MKYIKPYKIFENSQDKSEIKINDNFWKWFSNSKVVDKNGNPLVVYHGTDINFKSFSKDKIGKNHWQSKSDVHRGGFFFTDKKNKAHHGSIVKEVYLKILNPLVINFDDKYGYEFDYYHATDYFDINSSNLFDESKENDGIIIKTQRGSLYVTFEPSQIKSIYNDGTWGINVDNIFS